MHICIYAAHIELKQYLEEDIPKYLRTPVSEIDNVYQATCSNADNMRGN